MARIGQVKDPDLERAGKRLMAPSGPFLAIAAAIAVIGVILLIAGSSWVWILGIVLVVLSGPPAVAGVALLTAAAVTRWAARRQPFA